MTDWQSFLEEHKKLNRRVIRSQITLIFLFAFTLFFVGYTMYLHNTKPIRPMFVGVDSLGRVVKTGEFDTQIDVNKVKLSDIVSWIEACRSFSRDLKVKNAHLRQCSSKLIQASDSYNLVDTFIKNERDTIKDKRSITVFVKSIIETDIDQYLIEWSESHFNESSTIIKKSLHTASIKTIYEQSENPSVFYQNPLGTYIFKLKWNQKR